MCDFCWGFFFYTVSGWAHHFFPESESSRVLFIPSGYWSPNLYVEGQCHSQSDCGLCDIGLELMGCLPFHEFSCQSQEKSTCTLPCFSYVCISWFSYHCHWLKVASPSGVLHELWKLKMELHRNVMWCLIFISCYCIFLTRHNIFESSFAKYDIIAVSNIFVIYYFLSLLLLLSYFGDDPNRFLLFLFICLSQTWAMPCPRTWCA